MNFNIYLDDQTCRQLVIAAERIGETKNALIRKAVASHGVVDPMLAGIERSEWRLRWSRARIQEFLGDGPGLDRSIGTIHQTIHEARAAVAPVEDEWIQALLASDLLHADTKKIKAFLSSG